MAQIQRRNTDSIDHVHERQERRKSGIFFFNRSFKRSSTSKGENESTITSDSTTPNLGPDLKKTESGHSIPATTTQTSTITAEAERPLSSTPPRPQTSSSTEALQKLTSTGKAAPDSSKSPDEPVNNTEDLPTPPHTPGPSTTAAARTAGTDEWINDNPSEATGKSESADGDKVTEDAAPASTNPTSVDESTGPALFDADKVVSYHEDADLHIRVQEASGLSAIYTVRSSILEGVSRVWKQTLSLRPSNTIEVSDPAFGLDVLFSIAHYKFHDLPVQPTVSELYEIALVADKFQATHLLVPFIKEWVASLNRHVLMAGARKDEDKTLVLAWLLGEARWFSRVVSKCANKAQLGPDGQLLDSEGNLWSDQPVSSEVLDIIAATRLEAIDSIIKAVSTPVHKLLNPQWYPGEEIKYCYAPEGDSGREECEQLQLGSAIMGLSKAKLWPPPEPSRIKVSPVDLAKAYGDVRTRRYQVSGVRSKDGESVDDAHAKCGFGHLTAIDRVLSTPAQLTQRVTKQLQVRAKKSGAFGDELFEELRDFVVEGDLITLEKELKRSPVYYKQTALKTTLALESSGKKHEDENSHEAEDTASVTTDVY
ncbi:hypothetical protein VP1G_10143 [Cytospora mali]|uniref:Uncharacterized protein n=1 Tax=Cytospora mali TaxID=578113 RepID=A0A194VGW9_CYTMA|nr:hypothetical protein VP1G_10143 [Valsa mali var. pyri (nom. inval.)]